MSLFATGTSQTVGPYLHIGLDWLVTSDIAGRGRRRRARAHRRARCIDGDGKPSNDGAGRDLAGQRARQVRAPGGHAGQAAGDGLPRLRPLADRRKRRRSASRTIKPGRVPGPDGKLQAPHLVVDGLHARACSSSS